MPDLMLTPADDWLEAIRDHDGDGTITLCDGDYEASRIVTDARICRIAAQNLGAARITGRWDLSCQQMTLIGLDLRPPPANRLLMAKLAYVELDDCKVDARSADIDTLALVSGGVLRVVSHSRESTWDIGGGVQSDVLDVDGAALKGIRWRMNFREVGRYLNGIVLDTSKAMLADFRSYGYGFPQAGTMIAARRASTLVFQGELNRIENVARGIFAAHQARVHILKPPNSRLVMRTSILGFQDEDGGKVTYDPGAVVFAGNGTDHAN